MEEVKIKIPDGYELVQTGEGKWEQRKIEKKLPKTWEEFCKTHPVKNGEAYISADSSVLMGDGIRFVNAGRNYLPNKETAEAFLALMQLIQLRDCYNGNWVPDWAHSSEKYVIGSYCKVSDGKVGISSDYAHHSPRILTFKSKELRDQFLENFRDLIEIAKPLI